MMKQGLLTRDMWVVLLVPVYRNARGYKGYFAGIATNTQVLIILKSLILALM